MSTPELLFLLLVIIALSMRFGWTARGIRDDMNARIADQANGERHA